MAEILYKELSYQIQGAFYDVYKTFRNAHKESVCHNALIENFINRGLQVEKEKRIDIYYQGKKMGTYVPDGVVNDLIIIEIKCKPKLLQSDISQFWHYLKSSDYKVGYLVNFGKPDGVEFIRRVYDTARISAKQRENPHPIPPPLFRPRRISAQGGCASGARLGRRGGG